MTPFENFIKQYNLTVWGKPEGFGELEPNGSDKELFEFHSDRFNEKQEEVTALTEKVKEKLVCSGLYLYDEKYNDLDVGELGYVLKRKKLFNDYFSRVLFTYGEKSVTSKDPQTKAFFVFRLDSTMEDADLFKFIGEKSIPRDDMIIYANYFSGDGWRPRRSRGDLYPGRYGYPKSEKLYWEPKYSAQAVLFWKVLPGRVACTLLDCCKEIRKDFVITPEGYKPAFVSPTHFGNIVGCYVSRMQGARRFFLNPKDADMVPLGLDVYRPIHVLVPIW